MEEMTRQYTQAIEGFSEALTKKDKQMARLRKKTTEFKLQTMKTMQWYIYTVLIIDLNGEAKSKRFNTQEEAVDFILEQIGLPPKGKTPEEQLQINQIIYDLKKTNFHRSETDEDLIYTISSHCTGNVIDLGEQKLDFRMYLMGTKKERPTEIEQKE